VDIDLGEFRLSVVFAASDAFGLRATAMTLAARGTVSEHRCPRPSFRDHIGVVIRRRTKEEMTRAATRSIIAMVANKDAIRDLAVAEEVCEAVGA
jgi:hypothetical protein